MFPISFPRASLMAVVAASAVLLSACGGGGGSITLAGVGSGGTGFASGTVTKGPVNGAMVTAYGVSGGMLGAMVGTTTTDANGNFNMNIGSYSGPMVLQASMGSYKDEATGTSMPMATGDVMTAVLPTVAAGSNLTGIQVTPVTAMAQAMAQHMTGGMTDANIATANQTMGSYFAVSDVLHVQPMNPLVTGSGTGATQDAKNYGMTLAAMSQYAQTLGLGSSSAMVTAMMNDAMDGVFDGKAGTTAVQMGGMGGGMMMSATAGSTGMGAAMNTFMNSTQNKSGVTTPDLATKLNGASGQIPPVAPMPMKNATVSGTAFNGPVSNAMVTAFAINGGVMGAQLGSVATDSQGNFTLALGNYSGPVMLQMSGATYFDEATKTTVTMRTNEFMSAVLPTVASGATVTGVWMTPVTAMAQSRAAGMSGGMTDANIAAANAAMGNYFSIGDILHTQPMNPNTAASGTGASQDARNYGMTLAAMSQYAKSLNMPLSSTLVAAMMNDAADGMMGNSAMASTAGTSGLVNAMTNFMNSPANISGLTVTDMLSFMQKLTGSGGKI